MPGRLGRVLRAATAGSLGGKLIAILATVGIAGSLALALLLALVIMPSFRDLERGAVREHVERTQAVLRDYAGKVEGAVRDYGDWNASYDYVDRPTRAFEAESFSTLAMANLGVEGMAYVRPDGRILIARWIGDERDAAGLRRAFVLAIGASNLERIVGRRTSAAFYQRLGGRLAAIGIARVRRSDGGGQPRGFVLMARAVDGRQLSSLLQLPATIDLNDPPTAVTTTAHADRMEIAVPVVDAARRPVAAARYAIARDVPRLGERMLLFAVGGAILLLIVVLVALRAMIARLVLAPLARLERHMQTVRASGSLRLLDDEARADEIGALGRAFNAMLAQLRTLREQLEVQSFALGRTESAVAVMHNVRNALSPISTIISHGIALDPPVEPQLLTRAVDELGDPDVTPERRAKLSAYVAGAVAAIERDRIERGRQLQVGRDALSHVLEIIGSQQATAHERPPLETCDVTELIARNATIARYSGERSAAFSFPARPHLVRANRLLLSQVIGNLFANATEAIAEQAHGGTITVTVEEAGEQVQIAIRDNGHGFAPDQATHLFQRGFSTRPHKSGGLGLHWCANSMVAMDGSLRLESEGPGRGAVAWLTLRAAADAPGAIAA